MADGKMPFLSQPQADLLGIPVLGQQALDGDPRLNLVPAALHGQTVGLLRPIALQPSVAAHLATDRGLMNAHDLCDLGLAMLGFHQGVYLISLLLGKLWVDSH